MPGGGAPFNDQPFLDAAAIRGALFSWVGPWWVDETPICCEWFGKTRRKRHLGRFFGKTAPFPAACLRDASPLELGGPPDQSPDDGITLAQLGYAPIGYSRLD